MEDSSDQRDIGGIQTQRKMSRFLKDRWCRLFIPHLI